MDCDQKMMDEDQKRMAGLQYLEELKSYSDAYLNAKSDTMKHYVA